MLPDFQDIRHMARLSALSSGRLYPPGRTPGTHFCSKLSRTQCYSVGERIMSIEPATFGLVAQCLNQLRHLVTYSRGRTANISVVRTTRGDIEGVVFTILKRSACNCIKICVF